MATKEPDRLAVYGSLAPGGENHDVLSEHINGEWREGVVEGDLIEDGWGAEKGYPALQPREGGPPVKVHVLESSDLFVHWRRLDAFEGEDYERMIVPVKLDDGTTVKANIYAVDGAGD